MTTSSVLTAGSVDPDLILPRVHLAHGTRVEIPMPFFASGRRAREPVGWLSSNNLPSSAEERTDWGKAVTCWRVSARDGYRRARVPQNLGRVLICFQVRYAAGTQEQHRYDPSNLELTYKPIIDALQPEQQVVSKAKGGGKKIVILYGWGVIPNDKGSHLLRSGHLPVGDDLPANSPYGGMVIAYVFPVLEVQQ